jgi:ubiquitin carboxyl-terminal hydrolase L3
VPSPIVAALFVFPESKHINNYFFDKGDSFFQKEPPNSLYYMKQIAENACGTIAMLHCLTNLLHEFPFIFEEESFATRFWEGSLTMSPEQRAEYLNTCKLTIKKKEGDKSLKEVI